MIQFSDEQIIRGIIDSDQSILIWLYRTQFSKIRKYILRRGGNPGIIDDIFQEALLIIFTKIRNENLHLTCSFSTYFFAICKNLWFHELRVRRKFSNELQPYENMVAEPEPFSDDIPELKKIVEYHFNKLSEDCRRVLQLHFSQKSLAEIAEIMGFKDVKYAADRKYRCKQYLFNRIINDPNYKKIRDGLY